MMNTDGGGPSLSLSLSKRETTGLLSVSQRETPGHGGGDFWTCQKMMKSIARNLLRVFSRSKNHAELRGDLRIGVALRKTVFLVKRVLGKT